MVSLGALLLAYGLYDDRIAGTPTPAPAALALFGLGFAAVALRRGASGR